MHGFCRINSLRLQPAHALSTVELVRLRIYIMYKVVSWLAWFFLYLVDNWLSNKNWWRCYAIISLITKRVRNKPIRNEYLPVYPELSENRAGTCNSGKRVPNVPFFRAFHTKCFQIANERGWAICPVCSVLSPNPDSICAHQKFERIPLLLILSSEGLKFNGKVFVLFSSHLIHTGPFQIIDIIKARVPRYLLPAVLRGYTWTVSACPRASPLTAFPRPDNDSTRCIRYRRQSYCRRDRRFAVHAEGFSSLAFLRIKVQLKNCISIGNMQATVFPLLRQSGLNLIKHVRCV